MICPCCGGRLTAGADACGCGARFVGNPLDIKPVQIPQYGPAATAVATLGLVTAGALIFTKWLALGAILVVWTARRAMNLARRDPQNYGGYRVAAGTLAITVLAGSVVAGYTVVKIPEFLELREERKAAATRAAMYQWNRLLEDYRRHYGSFPSSIQALKKFTNETLPLDYWEREIRYQSFTEAIADSSLEASGLTGTPKPGREAQLAEAQIARSRAQGPKAGINLNNFELRSAGPDGKIGTSDDIIMRDGFFYTLEQIKAQSLIVNTTTP